ncbi:uncharacterized protein LOC103714036 [Phoenix dactylifera]|uniref:Uncharacterized protein LOC103714036 n=1 Tax=Phoenix dactylifera TaxID=42345 RepID=A0A8B7CHL7_PHODC|nr:uncharacterized protein LOC103714036 [Phoenix dactylifera]
MGFFRRIAGFLGLARDEANGAAAAAAVAAGGDGGEEEEENKRTGKSLPRGRAKGFRVQVPLTVERPSIGPVLIPCGPGEGGVQGFRWYTRRLRIDEDGDVADEFLHEIVPQASSTDKQMARPKFQVKYNNWPTAMAMRKQVIAVDGNVKLCLEHQGKLQWV